MFEHLFGNDSVDDKFSPGIGTSPRERAAARGVELTRFESFFAQYVDGLMLRGLVGQVVRVEQLPSTAIIDRKAGEAIDREWAELTSAQPQDVPGMPDHDL